MSRRTYTLFVTLLLTTSAAAETVAPPKARGAVTVPEGWTAEPTRFTAPDQSTVTIALTKDDCVTALGKLEQEYRTTGAAARSEFPWIPQEAYFLEAVAYRDNVLLTCFVGPRAAFHVTIVIGGAMFRPRQENAEIKAVLASILEAYYPPPAPSTPVEDAAPVRGVTVHQPLARHPRFSDVLINAGFLRQRDPSTSNGGNLELAVRQTPSDVLGGHLQGSVMLGYGGNDGLYGNLRLGAGFGSQLGPVYLSIAGVASADSLGPLYNYLLFGQGEAEIRVANVFVRTHAMHGWGVKGPGLDEAGIVLGIPIGFDEAVVVGARALRYEDEPGAPGDRGALLFTVGMQASSRQELQRAMAKRAAGLRP